MGDGEQRLCDPSAIGGVGGWGGANTLWEPASPWEQLAQSVLFPPPPLAGKLGIDHAPQGAVRRKEEVCSGANVPWCYFAGSENNCATNQEIPGLKSVARCTDAILRAHA